MTSKTFSPISPQRWQDIKQAINSNAGTSINTDEGEESVKGIDFSWKYAENSLYVQINSVSWVDGLAGYDEETVLQKFAVWVEGVS